MYVLYGGKNTRTPLVQMVLDEVNPLRASRASTSWNANTRVQRIYAINPAGFVPAIITPEGDVLH